MLIDTHTHLADDRFLDIRPLVISEFKNDSLDFVIEIGSDYDYSLKAYELAINNKDIYCTLGIHPHEAKSADKYMYDKFKQLSIHNKVVAIGEIGLDYYYDLSERDVQKRVFAQQLQLANELSLPLVLHLRDAYEDMFNILKDNEHLLNNGGVFHCYSGSVDMLQRFLPFDFYFAFGGAITFKNAKKDDVIKAVPIDRLMIETDCPYLTPEPFRGKLNQPKYVSYVYDKVSSVIGMDKAQLEQIVTKNVLRLFKKIVR